MSYVFMGCSIRSLSVLVVFMLTPLCVSAAEESSEAVSVANIPVTQTAPSISFSYDSVPQLETNKLYPAEFLLAKIKVSMDNNPSSEPDGGGYIAYRFTPELGGQSTNTAIVGGPGAASGSDPVFLKFANEDYYATNKTADGEEYRVKYILIPGHSEAVFDLVLQNSKNFHYPGKFSVGIDYAIYHP
ncbi:hypothetical protein [Serratia fonticola]|uniref:hypothetical protein n=1 Tax=Serratia fonticola TaxID=47917 RepID=UPI002DB8EBA9|nr:hypothetical protein [Serratia fonticola]MEB7884019.1 hypothetical protein [Serratia fonticola]